MFSRESSLWMMLFEGQEWLKDRLKHKGCLKRTVTPGNAPIPHCATGGCQSFSGFRVIKCHRYHAVCKDMVPYNVREKKPEYIKLFTAAVMPMHLEDHAHTHKQTDKKNKLKKKTPTILWYIGTINIGTSTQEISTAAKDHRKSLNNLTTGKIITKWGLKVKLFEWSKKIGRLRCLQTPTTSHKATDEQQIASCVDEITSANAHTNNYNLSDLASGQH